jgi:hypothetical protein
MATMSTSSTAFTFMWCSVSWGIYLPLYIGKGKNGSKVNEKLKLSVSEHELSGASTA